MPEDQKEKDLAAGDKSDKIIVEGEKEKEKDLDTKKDQGADKGADGAKEDKKDNAKAPEPGADDGKEPESRKRLSKQDFIIGRQKAKLAKKEAKENGEEDNSGDEGGDNEVADEDASVIRKVMAETLSPIIEKSLAEDDNKEVGSFLSDNPDFKPYEAKARRYMQHPSRRALPIEAIFYEVAGKDLIKIGAKRQQEADLKGKDSQTGGGSNRSGEGAKSVWDMTPEQFAAEQERVRRGN